MFPFSTLKSRYRRSKHGPRPPSQLDEEVKSLGGSTNRLDTTKESIQAQKSPISKEARIVELSREQGRLRSEAEYWRTLVEHVGKCLPRLLFHLQELEEILRTGNAEIERRNREWETRTSVR